MIDLKKLEVWFVTGSKHLYGEEILRQVADSVTLPTGMASAPWFSASAKYPIPNPPFSFIPAIFWMGKSSKKAVIRKSKVKSPPLCRMKVYLTFGTPIRDVKREVTPSPSERGPGHSHQLKASVEAQRL